MKIYNWNFQPSARQALLKPLQEKFTKNDLT